MCSAALLQLWLSAAPALHGSASYERRRALSGAPAERPSLQRDGSGPNRTGPRGGTTLFYLLLEVITLIDLLVLARAPIVFLGFFLRTDSLDAWSGINCCHNGTDTRGDIIIVIIYVLISTDKSVMMAAADWFNTPAANRPVGYKETLSLTRDEWCPLLCRTCRLAERRVSWDI